jgi:hypothetical protein
MFRIASLLAVVITIPAFAEKVPVKVDPRVELLSIVFRLAGNSEYNMSGSESPYAEDVQNHFGRFREHETVQLAKKLRAEHSIGFDAVMSLAVHLADDPWNTQPRTPLEPRPAKLEGRWTTSDAAAFIESLKVFCRDADFKKFVDDHAAYYLACEEKMSDLVNKRDYVGWFDHFFGARQNTSFVVIIGLLNGGGNYGISMKYPDGREEITPIIGIYKWDEHGLPAIGDEATPTIVHEFCHCYTNPIVDANYAQLQDAGDKLFAGHSAVMRSQAYSSGKTVLYESLVRGVVAYHMRREDGAAAGAKQILSETMRGFDWTRDLVQLLGEYDAERDRYPDFEAFAPRLITFINEAASRDAQMKAATSRPAK